MADPDAPLERVLKVFVAACWVVALVAGLTGSVMLVSPDATDRYFSWPIGPPPLAALAGEFYLASAAIFATLAVRRDWPASRGVCFGILAFTLPTLVATVHHRDLFDWSRWQAVAWVALFAGSPITFSTFLFLLRGRNHAGGSTLPAWARGVVGVLAAVYAFLAGALLLAPARVEDVSPFALPGLSGRFLGSWCAFLAVVALFAMAQVSEEQDRTHEATVPLIALTAWPVAAMLAALRSFDDLEPVSRRVAYLALLVALAGLAAAALAGRRTTAPPAGS